LEYAERAYRADSNNRWYAQNYATQLIAARKYRESMPIYRALLRLNPRDIDAYHALAILYASGGMPYSAIAILDSAEIRTGYNLYLASMKQRMLIETRQYDKAITDGQRIVEEFPYDSEARTNLALAYEASGCDSLAERSYEEAFRIDTTNIETLVALVDYYDRKGDMKRMFDYERRIFRDERVTIEEKIDRLEQYTSDMTFYSQNFFNVGSVILGLMTDYPTNRKVVDAYASHLLGSGENMAAIDLLRRHLDDATTTALDYISLIQLESYLSLSELVATDLAAGLMRFPQNRALRLYAAMLALNSSEYDKAISMAKQCLKLSADDIEISETWGFIGDIYHEIGEDKRAFRAYDKALNYNPDNVAVLNNYAYFLSLLDRDLERALSMSARAIELERGNATYIDTYAWVLHRLGRNEEAKVAMRQALSLSGQKESALLAHYGDILWALGEKFMADTYWKKAVEMGYDAEEMRLHQMKLKENEKR
jgi:tetratricopeptide (TPR) repeat protein